MNFLWEESSTHGKAEKARQPLSIPVRLWKWLRKPSQKKTLKIPAGKRSDVIPYKAKVLSSADTEDFFAGIF